MDSVITTFPINGSIEDYIRDYLGKDFVSIDQINDLYSEGKFKKQINIQFQSRLWEIKMFEYRQERVVALSKEDSINLGYYTTAKSAQKLKNEIDLSKYIFDKDVKDQVVGFVNRELEKQTKYGITINHGLILYGAPGNGKTIYLKLLQQTFNTGAIKHDYVLDRPSSLKNGKIQLYDDVNLGRFKEGGKGYNDIVSFMDDGEGKGYIRIFTTNSEIDDISPAMKRPGRISRFIEIKNPKENIRRSILSQIPEIKDLDKLVDLTYNYTIAEIQLLKNFLIDNDFDNDKAIKDFESRINKPKTNPAIGFGT